MPAISDPGIELVRTCIENDISINVLPGPSASLVALVLSGLNTERFTFIGFLPEKSTQRIKELEELKEYKETLIFYEAPHRIKKFLTDLYGVFGNRKVSISRELTKYYEETKRGDLSTLIENLEDLKEKGEFVVVVEGYTKVNIEIDIKKEIKKLLEEGYSKKDAVKFLVKEYDLKKNEVYEISLEL